MRIPQRNCDCDQNAEAGRSNVIRHRAEGIENDEQRPNDPEQSQHWVTQREHRPDQDIDRRESKHNDYGPHRPHRRSRTLARDDECKDRAMHAVRNAERHGEDHD